MNNDLISREALKKEIIELNLDNTSHWSVIYKIDNAPTVDIWQLRQEVTENALKKAEVLYGRPQGKWVKIFDNPFTNGYVCPFCGHKIQVTEQFLPEVTECEVCGAELKGGKE